MTSGTVSLGFELGVVVGLSGFSPIESLQGAGEVRAAAEHPEQADRSVLPLAETQSHRFELDLAALHGFGASQETKAER